MSIRKKSIEELELMSYTDIAYTHLNLPYNYINMKYFNFFYIFSGISIPNNEHPVFNIFATIVTRYTLEFLSSISSLNIL